jgi:hypothetical protein
MQNEIFRAGVRPGAPGCEDEIKILLCYIIGRVGEISFDQLYDALCGHSLVNYFELVSILEKLVGLDHLTSCPEGYGATELGRAAALEFERKLPVSVREKALLAAQNALLREKRRHEVKIAETPHGDGFMIDLSIPENTSDLLLLRVFAPTKEDCRRIKTRFLNAPLTIYKGVTALLSGDEKILGEIFEKEEKLF